MSENILKGPEFKPNLDNITLGEFFFENAEKYGDRICQINADSDQSEMYFSVKERSIRLAIHLQQKGINSQDIVASCCYNSLENTIPIISSLYLGAKVVNLDPTLSSRQTKYLLTLVSPRMIFVDEESLELIENCLNEAKLDTEIVVFGENTKYTTFSDLVRPCSNENTFRPVKVDVHDTAVMFFSSGTTGLPKAVCHSHYSFLQILEITYQSGYSAAIVLHVTTFYWISGMAILTRIFVDGSTRVFARSIKRENSFKMIEKYKLTTMFVAPIFTHELTNVANPEKYDISSFRFIVANGTAMSIDRFNKLSCLLPKVQIIFGYGTTEAGPISIFHPERDENFIKTKLGSPGKAAPNTIVKIVNPDSEEVLEPHQKGEIRVKSAGMMKGYYQMDSSSCFDSDGFFKTGDIGYYDEDKCIYVVERMKEMFKYKCWHIVPTAIEAVLLEHPAVAEAVVFGIPRGEDGEIPAACVVLKQGFDAGKEEIEKFIEERVADMEKLRGGVMFVTDLPKTPTGKLIRNESRDTFLKSL